MTTAVQTSDVAWAAALKARIQIDRNSMNQEKKRGGANEKVRVDFFYFLFDFMDNSFFGERK
jgi:hypothetical protein